MTPATRRERGFPRTFFMTLDQRGGSDFGVETAYVFKLSKLGTKSEQTLCNILHLLFSGEDFFTVNLSQPGDV